MTEIWTELLAAFSLLDEIALGSGGLTGVVLLFARRGDQGAARG